MCRKGDNIRKRKDGRWEARYIRYRDSEGKIHYGSLYGKSYREVKDKRNKKITELPEYGIYRHTSGTLNYQSTVEEAAEYWKQNIRHTIKASTFSNYEQIAKNQILPMLGTFQIRKITNQHISSFIRKKQENELAVGTIHVILSVLRSILNSAAQEGIYTAEAIHYPHISGAAKEIKTMNSQDYQTLETFLMSNMDSFHFGLLLCMHTGIRVGELSGLRWGDIDLGQRKVKIRRTVVRIRNLNQAENPQTHKIPKTILHIGPPKTEHSNREIPLPDKLVCLAKSLCQEEKKYILTGSSRCMEPRAIQRKYASLLKACSIPQIKIHSLRHQFSCRWVEHGFDAKSLSEILGHTSVRTTMDLYVHIQAETKRQYMNEMMEKAI